MTTESQPITPAPETQPEVPVVSEETTPAGVTPPPIAPPVVPPTQPKYLTMEDAERLMAQAVQKATETDWRKIQASQDREAAAIRRLKEMEAELNTVSASLNQLDPELKEKMELERYRGRERSQAQIDAEENQRRAFDETVNQFYGNLSEYAKEVGVDPTHKNLDWGQTTESLTVRQNRFLKSVAKIQKDQVKAREDSVFARLQAETLKMRKELGLETVDRTPSVSSGSSADFLSRFAKGDIPLTKENIEKYSKSLEE